MREFSVTNRYLLHMAILVATIVLSVSCNQVEVLSTNTSQQGVPLQVSSGLTSVTRAVGTAWESNDQIGVFTTANVSSPTISTKSGALNDANVLYQIDADISGYDGDTSGSLTNAKAFKPLSTTATIYLPFDGSPVNVYAYYPYTTGIGDDGIMSLNIESSKQTTPKEIDLMTASAISTSQAPIDALHPSAQLLFNHRLSKITINVKAGSGYSDSEILGNTAITLKGTPHTASFALYTSTLSNFSTATNIVPRKLTSATDGYLETYEVIVLPNETGNEAGEGREIEFKVGDTENGYYRYAIPSNKSFVKGENTIYNITLSPTGLNISASIVGWSEGDPVNQTLK